MAKKIYLLTFSLLFAVVGVISISAATSLTKTGQLTFRNIKLVVNDTAAETESGLEPFIYEDRVYVPISDVAEALNKDISWDDATSTVTIKEKPLTDSDMAIVPLDKDIRVQLKPGADGKDHFAMMNLALGLADISHAGLISEKEDVILDIAAKMIENLDYETVTQTDIISSIETYMQATTNQILGGDYVSQVFVTTLIFQ